MPPKAKQPANGKSEAKPKPAAPGAAPVASASEGSKPATTSVVKPDATAHHAEQDSLKKEIDQLQAKLVSYLFSFFTLPDLFSEHCQGKDCSGKRNWWK